MDATSESGNNILFGPEASQVTAIGGDVHGDVTTIWGTPAEPVHTMHVESRWPAPVTDRTALVLNVIMTATSIGSLGIAAFQVFPQFAQNGIGSLMVGHIPYVLIYVGLAAGTAAIIGWSFGSWLKRRVYANTCILGRVPEGRSDSRGGARLHLTKVRGTCAVDGSPMKPTRVPMHVETLYMSDGSKRVKYTDYQLRLACRSVPGDAMHQAKIDLSSTEAP